MSRRYLYPAYLIAALTILAVMIWLTAMVPPESDQWLLAIPFGLLIVFTDTFGVRLAGGVVSLLPMTTVAAYLVTGLVPTGWAAYAGALAYGAIRIYLAERLQLPREADRGRTVLLTAVNATMHTASILAGGLVFQALGGRTPLTEIRLAHVVPLLLLGLVFVIVNHLIVSPAIASRGRAALRLYLRSLPTLIFYEGGPLIFAPLMALIYMRLGLVQFGLFVLLIVVASLITRNLALTSGRLERRVKELDSLQAVGQALSASLNLGTILEAVHTQAAALMPAENFYIALYDAESDEVSFPFATENGKRVSWRSRRMGNGLTEHILRTNGPLLIRRDVGLALTELGLDQIGQTAVSWLGVPISAGAEPLGVIAVQSYSTPDAYDPSHQEVLSTIAAQAAVAIQNARLYARTDEALARRVQELDSILRTTREGVLLLDPAWRVVAANRALAGFLGVAQAELAGFILDPRPDGVPLIALIGYTPEDLKAACQDTPEKGWPRKEIVVAPGPPERHVERTLAPVRDREGTITGWLLVFRDLTEELALAQLREDMTRMLVHDLRSPLTVLRGGLEMLQTSLTEGRVQDMDYLLKLTQRGSDRLLDMINALLDISRLESGQLVIYPAAVNVEDMLRDAVNRLAPLAAEAHIVLEITVVPDLPFLYVDAELIRRVLSNLLDNAIKFTPDNGHIRVWASLDAQSDPPAVLIGVSDNGPGIPAEEQHRLFEKFQQTSVVGRRTGTGLGLPFCKLAVEAHGGQIWAESEVGKGSTFAMRLPSA
jgi:signal transduction histidine kinase